MKHSLLVMTLAVSTMFATTAHADTKDKTNPNADRYNVTDATGKLAFGKSYYEQDGKPDGANGNFYSTSNANWSIKKWPDGSTKKHIATYLHFPKCKSGAKIQLTTTGAVNLNLVVTNMENGQELARQNVSIAKGSQQWVDVLDAIDFPQSGWYKFDLECTKGPSYVGEFFYWQFNKTGSTEKIYTADYMSSPSVHLSAWKTTDPSAPSNRMYDWAYQEVMVPESSAIVGTYCMSLGVLHGYMGIQIDSNNDYPIIFSMWDNGSTDEDPNLPDYLRSGALDWSDKVIIARFANEGTGAQAKIRYGRNWIPGKWVKFITNARPEIVNIEIDDPANPGKKKTITYTNTLCSAWYQADGIDSDWHYIATIRQSGANNYFDGWYSFLENYNWPTGQWQRKAYYRNGGVHSLTNGKWYHANSVGFGHTDGGDKYGDRRDYGQGQTTEFDNCFFMSTGGYHEDAIQNANVVPLIRNFNPVDQATLDRLTAQVDAAIRKEQIKAMKENVSNACVIYEQSRFKVINKSDEATNEGAANVAATALFDGNEDTFWHSKWSGGETPYPHTVTIQVVEQPEDTHIGQITLVQKRASNYRAKEVTVSESTDGKTWTKLETLPLEDAERPNVELTTPITKPYIKLSFDKGYGNNLLCINEIYFKSSPSLDDLKKQAEEILAHENQFGGYSSADLAGLKSAYANGSVSEFNTLSTALNALAANGQPLKYGRVDAIKNVSSFKAYQVHNISGKGELIATTDGQVQITNDKINVVDPLNNWLVLYSTKTDKYYIYNLGAKKFLNNSQPFTLVDEPQPVSVSYANGGFRFGTADTWELRDNYVAQPPYEQAAAILASIDYAAEASVRSAKAAHAATFLEQAKEDAAFEFDSRYAGHYDVAPLQEALAKQGATTDEIAEAYDRVRISALPKPNRYYRLANLQRPTKSSMTNYLALSGTERNWKFIAHNSGSLGPAPTGSTLAENFRIYSLEQADNDSTFYIRCHASGSYLMSQNTDGGQSASAAPIRLSYEGRRLFRMQSGNNYLTITGSNELAEYGAREDAELFYFEEVTTLPSAISIDESGYGYTCLPVSVALPSTIEAYVPTRIVSDCLELTALNSYLPDAHKGYLPARLPVVLRSTSGTAVDPAECLILSEAIDASEAMSHNLLLGAPYRTTITRSDYVFGSPANTLRKTTTTNLHANRPYLPADRVTEGSPSTIGVGTTSIHQVTLIGEDGTCRQESLSFDLQGRPATSGTITVRGGHKWIEKHEN